MATPELPFPDFENPPVIEVALSVQFKALDSLRSPHYGLLWAKAFRDEGFSRIEEHGTLVPTFEDFESKRAPRVGIQLQAFDDAPPPARVWFLNKTGTQLIQVQPDRFIFNWRRENTDESYPRYAHIRERLKTTFNQFLDFVRSERLGNVVPEQCEATYVNHIVSGQGWTRHGELDHVATVWENRYSDSYLGRPEDVAFAARYRMPTDSAPLGRLYINLQSAFQSADKRQIYVLTLTARGRPTSTGTEGVFGFLDLGHEWIVRGFTSITRADMHRIWGRKT
jgi:uncharacterized protein (TIGR04255 family)